MSDHAALELVRAACVRIQRAADGRHLGTGFFAAPGMLLTAAHVVGRYQASELTIAWKRERWTPTARHLLAEPPPPHQPYPWPDAAILEVDHTDHPCVPLAAEFPPVLPGRQFYAWTYATDFDPDTVSGTSVVLDYSGPTEPDPMADGQLVRIDWGRVIGGMSGAPLLDTRDLKVCAIMKGTDEGRETPTAYATAISDVLALQATEQSVARLAAGQRDYLVKIKRDASPEELARWGGLPQQVARLLVKRDVTVDVADALTTRGVNTPLDEIPESEQALYVARQLFNANLDIVAKVFEALITASLLTRDHAIAIFDSVACCLPFAHSLAWWIPPGAADQLFLEATAEEPRIAHVPCDEGATLSMLVQRASINGPLSLSDGEAHSTLTPDESWLSGFEAVIRGAALGTAEDWWHNPELKAQMIDWCRGRLLRFPPLEVGDAELAEVRDKLGPFAFVHCERTLPTRLAGSGRVVRIGPAIDATAEALARVPYTAIHGTT